METAIIEESLLLELAQPIFSSMVGHSIERADEPFVSLQPCLTAAVQISGAWRGAVLLLPSDELAQTLASLMLSIPVEVLTQSDINDGIAELCNMFAGGLKSVLPGPSSLALPMVTRGEDYKIWVRRSHLAAVCDFVTLGEPLQVRVLEENVLK